MMGAKPEWVQSVGDAFLAGRVRLRRQGPDGKRVRAHRLAGAMGRHGDHTFVMSHDGQLCEKNLGPNTDAVARAVTRFDPDSSWTKVMP